MARDYAKVTSAFWTGKTGKEIRERGDDALIVAMYLFTAPSSNMIGLYYLPIPTLCHETGRTSEGAWKGLRSLGAVGFAFYDEDSETVWVPEMARYQVAESLKGGDNQCKGVLREAENYRKSPFFMDFVERYWDAFSLPGNKPARSPFEGPSKALRSQEQEQEQEQDQEKTPSPENPARQVSFLAPDPPPPASARERGLKALAEAAKVVVPERPKREPTEQQKKIDRILLHYARRLGKVEIFDDRDYALVGKALKAFSEEKLRLAIDGAKLDTRRWPDRVAQDGLAIVLGTADQIRKFIATAEREAPRHIAPAAPEAELTPPAVEPWRTVWSGLRDRGMSRHVLGVLLKLEQVTDGPEELSLRAISEFERDWIADNVGTALTVVAGKPVRLEVAAGNPQHQ